MQISSLDAEKFIKNIMHSNSFTTKQILKILATSADELEFPFPYEQIMMSPTSRKDSFILYIKNDSSKTGDLKLKKLVKEILEENNHPIFI
jgi:hypothetical protein